MAGIDSEHTDPDENLSAPALRPRFHHFKSQIPNLKFRILKYLLRVWTLFFATAPVFAAGTPALNSVLPRGGQRGHEVVIDCSGARLDKALDILFHEAGIAVTKVEQVDANRAKFTLKIDATCEVGLHRLRVRTANGVSNVKMFSVGTLPEIAEAEPNSDRAKPQPAKLPITVNGTITSEDVDCFSFEAKKGQTLAFEVEGMRLADTLFDPRLAIYDAAGNELAVADDTPLVRQDPAIVLTLPADGTYVAEVRETAYGGSGDSHYRLHMGAFPRPLACLPAGGKAGSEVEVTWLGDPAAGKQKIKLPTSLPTDYAILPERDGLVAPSPVPFHVSPLDAKVEVEPNNDHDHATPIAVPGGVSGVINGERDIDCFVFDAKKGQAFEGMVYARRLRSPLDPVLDACKLKGAMLTSADDSVGPDSVVRFTIPEDGKYVLQLRDLLFKSGPEYTYYLEARPIAPQLTLSIPRGLTPEQAKLAVAAGNRGAMLFTANRSDFGGPLVFSSPNLPPGVQLHSDTMHEAVNQIPIVFEAAPDAKPAGVPVDLVARHADPKTGIEGHILHVIDLIEVQANVVVYSTTVDRLALAVTEPVPFKIDIVEPKVPIVRRGMMELPIKLQRTGDFKGAVDARMLWNPPGTGSGSVNIPPDKSEGFIHIDANDGARVGKWKIAVVATADLGGGPFEVASQLATLEIADPFIDFALDKARTELGKPVEMAVKISQKTPFEGDAKIDLLGLPPKVATTQTAVTKTSAEVKYALNVPTSAPAGRHGGIFVRAVVMRNGEPIVHQSPPGELILDTPLPPKDPKAEAERAEAKRKAEEAKVKKKVERIASAAKRKAERDAAKKQAAATARPTSSMPATQASAAK